MVPSRFEPSHGGALELVAQGYYGSYHHRTYGLVWADTTWTPRWHMDREAWGNFPCYTDSGVQMLVWREAVEITPGDLSHYRLMTAEVRGNEVTPSESVGVIGINGFCDIQSSTQRGHRR